MSYLGNVIKHFKTICKHKKYVFQFCLKAGIPFQGLVHDLSKFSPTEFFESVKYYTGTRSPIDVCKEKNGYSKAWLHHKGRNKHHYEYWQDNFDNGTTHLEMPFKYALEMVCDYLGAAKAYSTDDKFSYYDEYHKWWVKKRENAIAMNTKTKQFIEYVLYYLTIFTDDDVLRDKELLLYLYNKAYHIDNSSDIVPKKVIEMTEFTSSSNSELKVKIFDDANKLDITS